MRQALVLVVLLAACVPATILRRNLSALVSVPTPPRKSPCAPGHRIEATWVGHATVLLRLDDVAVVTDPVFTDTVAAGFSKRLVAPGVEVGELPPISVAVVSHLHLDHFSLASLGLLEPRVEQLLLPPDGLAYVPPLRFAIDGVEAWQTFERGELRVTAVPVKHPSYRYAIDAAWMRRGATGWVFEYRGRVVYFGGDTAFDREAFEATARRFPRIDLALLPIGPVDPPEFARPTHLDGREALEAFRLLGARHFLPIHYDTFAHGIDAPGRAVALLRQAMAQQNVGDDVVHVAPIGACLTID